jgi:hypothetical protein
MRKGDGVMKNIFLLLVSASAFAAVDGTVIDGTTGKPAPNTIVSLVQPGQGGMQTLASVKSDADGHFQIDKSVQGPQLVQALYAGVLYNKVLMPGAPSNGLEVIVFDSTSKSGVAKVSQHFIVLQPSANDMSVSEGILYQGDPKVTFNDPANGTLRFYLPPEAKGIVSVTINAPGGMPIQRPAEKTNQPNVYKVSYPIKPGETRFDLAYIIPSPTPLIFAGKILHNEGSSDLVIPNGVTITGDNVTLAGQEPKTQASIYHINGSTFKVEVTGTGSLRQAEAAAPEEDTGAPSIEQVKPRIYEQLYPILGMTFTILALGSFLLYRRSRS